MRPTYDAVPMVSDAVQDAAQRALDDLTEWPSLADDRDGGDSWSRRFPLRAYPDWLSGHCEMVAKVVQVPEAYPAILTLASVSALAAGTVWVQPREPDDSWIEGTNLFLVLIAVPGARKTPVFKLAREPLEAHEAEMQRGGANDEGVLPRLLVGDITPEALGAQLAKTPALCLHDDEGTVFSTLAGRYSGGVPNLEVVLKAYSNSPIISDRVTTGTVRAERPALTMGLAVQPDVMQEAMGNSAFVGRGLMDRVLAAEPDTSSVQKGAALARQAAESDEWATSKDDWRDRMADLSRAIRALPDGNLTLQLDSGAADQLDAWMDYLQDEMDSGELGGAHAGWAAKLHGQTLRIAGCLHLAKAAKTSHTTFTTTINETTFADARTVAEWFILERQVLGVDIAVGGVEEQRYQAAKRVLIRHQDSWLTARDIYSRHRTLFPTAKDLDPALDRLVSEGLLQELDLRKVDGTRLSQRPARAFAIHPGINQQAMDARW